MAEGFPQYPPRTALPNLTLHESTVREEVDAAAVAQTWFSALVASITTKDAAAFRDLFFAEAWWRDSVAFSWTITSKQGPATISDHILGSTAKLQDASVITTLPLAPLLTDMGPMTVIQFGYAFTTQYGHGRGVVRLGNDGPGSWKAWTVSSQLEGIPEPGENTNFQAHHDDTTYQVLIVGAGQSGLMLGAWLDKLGVSYLIIDKAQRPGDAWRARYTTIKAHTPKYSDHFCFADFPADYPKWAARDDIAGWIDTYSEKLDLHILQDATVTAVQRGVDRWFADVTHNSSGKTMTYTGAHVVLATGIFPSIPIQPSFAGLDTFRGQAYHTAAHTSAAAIPDVSSKKVVIIGTGTSAHDIAQDFATHGAARVTMVQRGRIWAASSSTVEQFLLAPWNTPGVDTAEADLLATSMPLAIALTLGTGMAPLMVANDKTMLDGLEKAGMKLAKGEDGISLLDYQIVKLTGFYTDQGACAMIIDGRIQIKQCDGGVAAFNEEGVELKDGTRLEADVVVFATGFEKMTTTMEALLGKDVYSKVDDPCVGLDAETERAGLTRPTGVPGLWFAAGSFVMNRQLSKLLGLQIAAIERGLNTTHFPSPSK